MKKERKLGDVFASFGLSYVLAILLIGLLVYHAGIWNILANTRLLDPLIEVGVVRYHDGNLGVVDGIPDQEYYLNSQDPIDYRLVMLAALIYFAYWGIKGIKFHGAARFVGLKGSVGKHARAWLYGEGMNTFFPYRFGEASTTSELEAQGEDPNKARQAYGIMEFLTLVFQIGVFWLFGLFVTDYAIWFQQCFWAFLIAVGAWLMLRKTGAIPPGYWRSKKAAYKALANRPSTMAKLGGTAAFLMLLDDLTPFVVAMAFTGDHVILNVPFFVIQSGVVAAYIACRFRITPLGIGQWEWAFALALYVSGIGFPEAATIALLDSFLRHGTCLIVFFIVTLRYGVRTSFGEVLQRYLGKPATAAAAE